MDVFKMKYLFFNLFSSVFVKNCYILKWDFKRTTFLAHLSVLSPKGKKCLKEESLELTAHHPHPNCPCNHIKYPSCHSSKLKLPLYLVYTFTSFEDTYVQTSQA